MAGRVLIGIVAVFLLLGGFREPIIDGIKGWRTLDESQGFSVTTGGGITSSNVTLSYDLYQAAVAEVQSITSTEGTDAAVASSYSESDKKLLVGGLAPSKTRTLTVSYYAETDDSVMQVLGPFLAVLIFGGLIFAIVWGVWHGKR